MRKVARLAARRQPIPPLIHHEEDQFLIVNLGTATEPLLEDIEAIGRGYEPPVRTQVV